MMSERQVKAREGRSSETLFFLQETANPVPILETIFQRLLKSHQQLLGLRHVAHCCFQFQMRNESLLANDMLPGSGDLLLCLHKELL